MVNEGAPNNPKTTPAETEPRDGGTRGRARNLPYEGETAQRGATRRIEMYERQGEQSAARIDLPRGSCNGR